MKEAMQADEIAAKMVKEGETWSWDIERKGETEQVEVFIRQMDAEDEFTVSSFVAARYGYYTDDEGHDDTTANQMAAADGLTYIIFRTCMKPGKHDDRYFKAIKEVREVSLTSRYAYNDRYNELFGLEQVDESGDVVMTAEDAEKN